MQYLMALSDSAAAVQNVGRKARRLAQLSSAGHPVPDGFVLTFEALEAHLAQPECAALVGAALTALDDGEELADATERLRTCILDVPLAAPLAAEIGAAYAAMGDGAVAVRSSSSVEDGGDSTFTGQHDSFLNVRGGDSLNAKIKHVWASTFSDRAVAYSRLRGVSVTRLRMSVIVQRMIAADTSGVALTADPIGGSADRMVLSATFGVAEPLVAGAITADEWVVSKAERTVLEYRRGDKVVASVATANDGLTTFDLARATRHARVLGDAQIRAICSEVLAIEDESGGAAQDVEWAVADGRLWILQARPIVQPATKLAPWDNPIPGAVWRRNWRLGEWLPEPVTPLFADWLLPRLASAREENGTRVFDWEPRRTVFSIPKPWYCVVHGYFFARLGSSKTERPWRSESELDDYMRAETARLHGWRRRDLSRYVRHFQDHCRQDVRAKSPPELIELVDRLATEASEFWFFLAAVGYGLEEIAFKRSYAKLFPGEKPHHSVLFSGYPSRMIDAQTALYEIAARVRADRDATSVVLAMNPASRRAFAALPTWLQDDIRAFNEEHGHQVLSLDFYWPTLGESSERSIRAVQQLLRSDTPHPRQTLRLAQKRRARAKASLLGRLEQDETSRERFCTAVEFFQSHAAVREDCNYYLQIGWPLMRRAILSIGERMAAQGALHDSGQVFFLERREIHAWAHGAHASAPAGLGPVADDRRRLWERQRHLQAPDVLGDAPVPAAPNGDVLQGFGASVGVRRGRVRVVVSDSDAREFRTGDVLVLKAASPMFMPLMLTAAGLITEVGGVTTHSSLIARELGLPAVVNLVDATRRLANGQQVELNGSTGEVRLLPP